jgi:uncharacterized protein (DUF58 family)
MLNDQEKEIFEGLTRQFDAPAVEKKVTRRLRLPRRYAALVAVVGVVGLLVTFTFSLPLALCSLALAFAGLYGLLTFPRSLRSPRVRAVRPASKSRSQAPLTSDGPTLSTGAHVASHQQWAQGYRHLCAFVRQTGSADVPPRQVYEGFPLGMWVTMIKIARTVGELTTVQVDDLEQLGLRWA